MAGKVNILGIKLDNVRIGEARDAVISFLEGEGRGRVIVTPNSEMVMLAREDPVLAGILNNADLSVADGIGVVLASRLLGTPLQERVTGYDLLLQLFAESARRGYRLYLLGGKPGVVEKAGEKLLSLYPDLVIAGCHHGYLDREQEQRVIKEIRLLRPDLLVVGMGVPLQERFISRNLPEMEVKAAMTVGGAFDVISGISRRAPVWMQKTHLEWFFRLLQEPSRVGRMLALPRFALLAAGEYLKRKGRLFFKRS